MLMVIDYKRGEAADKGGDAELFHTLTPFQVYSLFILAETSALANRDFSHFPAAVLSVLDKKAEFAWVKGLPRADTKAEVIKNES